MHSPCDGESRIFPCRYWLGLALLSGIWALLTLEVALMV